MSSIIENQNNEKKRKYSVPAIENSFSILDLLSRKKYKESTLSEIAKALSLTPTSCYRILQQLLDLSIVRYDSHKKMYTLGPYLVILGERAKEHLDYISMCTPYLEELTSKTDLSSVLISRFKEDKVSIIAKVEAENFGLKFSVGRHFSIVSGGYGKSFLAYMEPETRNSLFKFLQEHNELSETLIEKLHHEFTDILNKGYSISYGDAYDGVFGVTGPIFIGGKMEMAIALNGLTARYNEEEVKNTLGPLVGETARLISEKLSANMS